MNVGKAIERAFTPPGTGGQEAAQQQLQAAQVQAAKPPPAPPTMPTIAPPTPPIFQPGQSPGQKQRAAVTATTMLGAAAAAGQTGKKTLLGQ